ncbi:MAG: STAS domain-containing protein [SAR324 cluster bacterium]|nr:STAS domain-containing protein [SAR324 cluster bacterium]
MIIEHKEKKDIIIITIEGSVVGNDVLELGLYVTNLLRDKPKALVMNLKDTTHLDSSAIGTIIMLFKMYEEKDIKFMLCQLNDRVFTISEIIRLDKIIPIYSTEKKALAYLK